MKKSVFLLKNIFKLFGITVITVVIVFSLTFCNKDKDSNWGIGTYEKLSKARFVPELHEVLPKFSSNSISTVTTSSVKSSDEGVSELNVADLDGSFNLAYFEYMIRNYFDGVRGMINFNKDAMVNRLDAPLPSDKPNAWNYLKEEYALFGVTTPQLLLPGDYIKWRFSESNGKMTVWEETCHTNRSNDLRKRKITLYADGSAEMYEYFTLTCENCYTVISPPFLSGKNSMMYSYCKGNDFFYYSISPDLPSFSYMAFSEVDGKKTGEYVSSIFNTAIHISSFEGNDSELFFNIYSGSVYAADNVFRSENDITIMKDGIAMTLTNGNRGNALFEFSIDVQGIDEIEKLYYIYPDKVFGKLYEPVGMLLTDGTELSLSDQPFEIQRGIVDFQSTGPLSAAAQFFTNETSLPGNVFDILPAVFDKTVAEQKFKGTNYMEKITALPNFNKDFRIVNIPDFEVKFENTENIINAIKTLILSKNPESGF